MIPKTAKNSRLSGEILRNRSDYGYDIPTAGKIFLDATDQPANDEDRSDRERDTDDHAAQAVSLSGQVADSGADGIESGLRHFFSPAEVFFLS